MSALSVIVDGGEVHLITDGAAYTPDGQVLHAIQKVLPLPHLDIAVGVRGPVMVITDLLFAASRYRTLDQLIEQYPAEVQGQHKRMVDVATKGGAAPEMVATLDFDVIVAGMDKRRVHPLKPTFAMLISSHPESKDRRDQPPFRWKEIEAAWISPPIEDLARIGAQFKASHVDGAKAILEAQRKQNGFRMGVFGQLTTIRREGIASRVVCRWEDVASASIEPTGRAA